MSAPTKMTEEGFPELVARRYWFDKCFHDIVRDKTVPLEVDQVDRQVRLCIQRSIQAHEHVLWNLLKAYDAFDAGNPN